jgi:hypothetical protein
VNVASVGMWMMPCGDKSNWSRFTDERSIVAPYRKSLTHGSP